MAEQVAEPLKGWIIPPYSSYVATRGDGDMATVDLGPRTFSARELNQNLSAAKRAAAEAPIMVTDRGQPAYVLMSYEDFAALKGERGGPTDVSLLEALQPPGGGIDAELDLPERRPPRKVQL